MQSKNAYLFGSFVIPEGAGPGDPRLEFDAENGAIRIYDSVGRLVASMAATSGTDGTYNWIPGIASYSSTLFSIIASLDSAGGLQFSAPVGNDPFLDEGLIAAGNPGVANPANRASLTVWAPGTRNGGGTEDGRAYIDLESTSANGANKGIIHVGFDSDVSNTCRTEMQGFVYAARWDAGGNTTNVENWKNLTMPGGWAAITPVGYRLAPDGRIHLRGIAQAPGVFGSGTVIGTLPVGYRPSQTTLEPMVYDSAAGIGRALITTAGVIELYEPLSIFPSLDGISFGVTGLL